MPLRQTNCLFWGLFLDLDFVLLWKFTQQDTVCGNELLSFLTTVGKETHKHTAGDFKYSHKWKMDECFII